MKQIFRLVHDEARARAHAAIDSAPDGQIVTIDDPTKTREQEAMYHAIFGEAAKSCTHLNRRFDSEGWKRLLVDQFRTDVLKMPDFDKDVRNDLMNAVQMVPSLDGCSIVPLGLQTRKFKKKTASAFIEWLNAFMAEKVPHETTETR